MNLQPSYNIAPTATVDVLIRRNSDQLELWQMGWGLIPSWWTKDAQGTAVDLQRARRDNHRQADVSRCLPGMPLHHAGVGLLLRQFIGNDTRDDVHGE